MNRLRLKNKVIQLRKLGKTYGEIQKILKTIIPKSTLSYWCSGVDLPKEYQDKIKKINLDNARKGRAVALIVNQIKRKKYLEYLFFRNKHLAKILENEDIAKIALVMLYLGEGAKNLKRGSLMFANSDPFIVSLFLYLLRNCYKIDESKFRCTLQCRADQNIKQLEKFWSDITNVPLPQFYKARVDPRTIGKKSKKPDYKGVCRIDYFSAEIFLELMQIPKIIYNGPIV